MKKTFIISLIIIPIFLLSFETQASLMSTFDGGNEGWSAYAVGSGIVNNFSWNNSGGNPGGNISAQGSTWYFESPLTWGGDWTSYVGGTLQFDIKIDSNGNGYTANNLLAVLDLAEPGDGIYLGWSSSNNLPLNSWNTLAVTISEANFSVVGSSLSFDDAIKQVTRIYILGDFLQGLNDTSYLDNVKVNPIPEPATMFLLGSGLIGLAGYGRKKLFKK